MSVGLDSDDPFNLHGKRSGFLGDDVPIPTTRAAAAAASSVNLEQGGDAVTQHCYDYDTDSNDDTQRALHKAATVSAPAKVRVKRSAAKDARFNKENARPALNSANASKSTATSTGRLSASECASASTLSSLVSAETIANLASPRWQECVAAIQQFEAALTAPATATPVVASTQLVSACVFTWLHHPGYGSSNMQIVRALYTVTTKALLSHTDAVLGGSTVRAIIPPVLSKLSDKKTAPLAELLLRAVTVASAPRTLMQMIAETLELPKVPKVIEATLLFLAALVPECTLGAFDVPRLLTMIRAQMESPQAGVRAAAVKLLATVYAPLGPAARAWLTEGLSSTMAQSVAASFQLEDEQQRVHGVTLSQPKLRGRGSEAHIDKLELESLIPRRDLTAVLDAAVLTGLRDKAWKPRLASLEALLTAIEASHGRVSLKDASVVAAIASSVNDANKILHLKALAVLRALVSATPDGLGKHTAKVLPPLLTALGDAKKNAREEGAKTVQVWLQRHGLLAVKAWRGAVESANARGDALALLADWMHRSRHLTNAQIELADLVAPAVDALTDKSAETRSAAERFLEHACQRGHTAAVVTAASRLKPAHQLQVKPVVERCRHAAIVAVSTAATTHAAAEPAVDRPVTQHENTGTCHHAHPQQHLQPQPAAAGPSPSSSSAPSEHPFLCSVDTTGRSRRVAREMKRAHHTDFRPMTVDEVTELTSTLETLVSRPLNGALTASEFARNLLAVEFFRDQLAAGHTGHLFAISDVLVRWATWKFADANPKLALALLGLVHEIARAASQAEPAFKFADTDFAPLLPTLVERGLGHQFANVRTQTSALLTGLRTLAAVSASRLGACVLKGFQSKNKRVCVECCEWMHHIAQEFNDGVSDLKRAVPTIVAMVAASDPTARHAALAALVTLDQALGTGAFWNLIDAQPKSESDEASRALPIIEERIKRAHIDAILVHTSTNTNSDNSAQLTPASSARSATAPAVRHSPLPSSSAPSFRSLTSSLASLEALQASLPHTHTCNNFDEANEALVAESEHRKRNAIEFLSEQLTHVHTNTDTHTPLRQQQQQVHHRVAACLPNLARALEHASNNSLRLAILRLLALLATNATSTRSFDSQTAIHAGRVALLTTSIDSRTECADCTRNFLASLSIDEELAAVSAAIIDAIVTNASTSVSEVCLLSWSTRLGRSTGSVDVPACLDCFNRLLMALGTVPIDSVTHAAHTAIARFVEAEPERIAAATRVFDVHSTLRQHIDEALESRREQPQHDEQRAAHEGRKLTQTLKGRRSRQLMQHLQVSPSVTASPSAIASPPTTQSPRFQSVPAPANALNLEDLLSVQPAPPLSYTQSPSAPSSQPSSLSSSPLSYAARFQAMQQRLRNGIASEQPQQRASGISQAQQPGRPFARALHSAGQTQSQPSVSSQSPAQSQSLESRLASMASLRARMQERAAQLSSVSQPAPVSSLAALMAHRQ